MTHWTERSIDDFLYRIVSDVLLQIEEKMESDSLSKAQLAEKLGVSERRVYQIFNNPSTLTLKTILRCARAVGLKIAVVAYEDGDPKNERGPVMSEIFFKCWHSSGKPTDFFSLKENEITYSCKQCGMKIPESQALGQFFQLPCKSCGGFLEKD
jgi:DNA-binding phage protein